MWGRGGCPLGAPCAVRGAGWLSGSGRGGESACTRPVAGPLGPPHACPDPGPREPGLLSGAGRDLPRVPLGCPALPGNHVPMRARRPGRPSERAPRPPHSSPADPPSALSSLCPPPLPLLPSSSPGCFLPSLLRPPAPSRPAPLPLRVLGSLPAPALLSRGPGRCCSALSRSRGPPSCSPLVWARMPCGLCLQGVGREPAPTSLSGPCPLCAGVGGGCPGPSGVRTPAQSHGRLPQLLVQHTGHANLCACVSVHVCLHAHTHGCGCMCVGVGLHSCVGKCVCECLWGGCICVSTCVCMCQWVWVCARVCECGCGSGVQACERQGEALGPFWGECWLVGIREKPWLWSLLSWRPCGEPSRGPVISCYFVVLIRVGLIGAQRAGGPGGWGGALVGAPCCLAKPSAP